jgi:hypothetical protein
VTDPQPIETCYRGNRFRSRLEARWAVAFDHMGLWWDYEPEGFELPSGLRYLPDFRVRLTRFDLWVEVKPTGGDVTKMIEFAGCMSDRRWRATVLREIPPPAWPYWWEEGWLLPGAVIYFGGDEQDRVSDGPYLFCACDLCGRVGFEYQGWSARIGCCEVDGDRGGNAGNDEKVLMAFAAARSERFDGSGPGIEIKPAASGPKSWRKPRDGADQSWRGSVRKDGRSWRKK